ncbi:hypothetical protein FRX31_009803 [Thalictrum thalictroides]|uniref:Uncharacterized protein n=1 Tax=Thalictrum thalictroides TaxID=46969 RepID=A0A7J6WVH1_THATH|nr:hypothetical protein FRX31_009803 [Thalictrum thalictroides]
MNQNPLNLLVQAVEQVEVDRAIRRIFLRVFKLSGLVGRTLDRRTHSRLPDFVKTQEVVLEWFQHGPNRINLEVLDEHILALALQDMDRQIHYYYF